MEVVKQAMAEVAAHTVVHNPQQRWFIDAWLPIDGRVLISQRTPRDDLWAEPDGDDAAGRGLPSIGLLLRAPDFEPEYVERGLAFGAVQRGAQEGFSLDGEGEFGFETVEQVRSFVRRIYRGSGPNTDGGAGAPPVPPSPDQDGQREPWPRFPLDDRGQAPESGWRLPQYESVEPAALKRQLFETDRRAAANLLLGSVEREFDRWNATSTPECVIPQLSAARLLTLNDSDFWFSHYVPAILAARSGITDQALHQDLEMIADSISYGHAYWPMFRPAYITHLSVWRLPRREEFDLGLPAHVHSWLDAISYLSADRSYFSEQPVSVWGPLLLALTATLAVGTADGWSWSRRPMARITPALVDRCIRMAAEWVPCAALPKELEDNIEQWSRRAGRGNSTEPPTRSQPIRPSGGHPSTEPGRRLASRGSQTR